MMDWCTQYALYEGSRTFLFSLCVCLSVCMSVCLSISVCLLSLSDCLCRSLILSVCLSLYICLSVSPARFTLLSVCVPIWIWIWCLNNQLLACWVFFFLLHIDLKDMASVMHRTTPHHTTRRSIQNKWFTLLLCRQRRWWRSWLSGWNSSRTLLMSRAHPLLLRWVSSVDSLMRLVGYTFSEHPSECRIFTVCE